MKTRIRTFGWLTAAIGLGTAAGEARAQDPVRLPEMVIKAAPGPKAMAGVVRDTSGFLIEGVDITIPKLKRRTSSRANGSFRLEDLPRGTHEVRARKFGYGPQVIEIKVDSLGGIGDFELVPIARALPAVTTSAVRLGLSGVVADTAFQTLPGAEVRTMGEGRMRAETDSMGRFFLPLRSGSYLFTITKPGFKDKVMSVSIPSDSGRDVRVALTASSGEKSPGEASILEDLEYRMTWMTMKNIHLYSHERMEKMGIEWLYDAMTSGWVHNGGRGVPDVSCYVLVDGGPKIERIDRLTIDEIESIEVYHGGYVKATPIKGRAGVVSVGKKNIADSRPSVQLAHTRFGNILGQANFGKTCPTAFVWTR